MDNALKLDYYLSMQNLFPRETGMRPLLPPMLAPAAARAPPEAARALAFGSAAADSYRHQSPATTAPSGRSWSSWNIAAQLGDVEHSQTNSSTALRCDAADAAAPDAATAHDTSHTIRVPPHPPPDRAHR